MKKTGFKRSIAAFGIVLLLTTLNCYGAFKKEGAGKRVFNRSKRNTSVKINLSAVKVKDVLFAFNKTTVPESSYSRLDHVAKLMADNNASVKLSGHTDNRGGYVYNWKLSQARAEAVKAYLISKGADSSRIAATEYGFTKPIASNKTRAGRQKNRRVDCQFVQ